VCRCLWSRNIKNRYSIYIYIYIYIYICDIRTLRVKEIRCVGVWWIHLAKVRAELSHAKKSTVPFSYTKCGKCVSDIEDLLAVQGRLYCGVIYWLLFCFGKGGSCEGSISDSVVFTGNTWIKTRGGTCDINIILTRTHVHTHHMNTQLENLRLSHTHIQEGKYTKPASYPRTANKV
jgi:hypothetical protein